MQIGIDFGTTHTSAAVQQDGQLHFFMLDRPSRLLRSMLYITREHDVEVGQKAIRRYLEENTGRLVITREKVVGTIDTWTAQMSRGPLDPDGPIHSIYDVTIDEDISSPGRLIQTIKMGLGQEDYDGTRVFDRFYTVQELIALLLTNVREKIEMQMGMDLQNVHVGRPVRYSADPAVDAAAIQKMREACELAGLKDVTFVPEPIAAATFYTSEQTSEKVALIFDFGGGTLDLSVIHVTPPNRHEVLGTYGVVVGGDKFDSAIMTGNVAKLLGRDARLLPEDRPIPSHPYELLERFETIPLLSRAENMSIIRNAETKSSQPEAFAKLREIVLNNYGFALFQEVEAAKRRLSEEEMTTIALEIAQFGLHSDITRHEFQVLISGYIVEVQQGLVEVLKRAGISADQVDAVVSTGGSSLIPIFKNILKTRFPNAEQVHSDTFGSVTAGLALYAE